MHPISKPIPPLPPFPPESLSRLLRQWSFTPGTPAPAAERLGSWFSWADAIEISQVLTTSSGKAASAAAQTQAASWASTELERLQAELAASFNHVELATGSEPIPEGATLAEQLATYLQHFAQQQRVIGTCTTTLRMRLRAKLALASDELARLAQLDEYIERAMTAPQLRATAGLGAVLETRAQKHYAADPLRWRTPLWTDLQRLLRAELDQKLQPVLGLIEALNTQSPP
ncbi:DUF3348 domain-containing protein [Paucibacter sp. Y2R2-4]|uniref:DUF3348 domain-containing protein n=1 Tax=Paucibacter sp. Y2R2-4 TaxID=2893553 RepID=UPI0021E40D16|nr:DUF3348 domain-containing protein [Paucibacter sp. Y2R2-4]MCV2348286.1 DUF3348 domain-containing protein [Paucibacter sp. Y2R2-4]